LLGRTACFIPSVGDALVLFLLFYLFLPVCFTCTLGSTGTFYSRGCPGCLLGSFFRRTDAGWVWGSRSRGTCRVFWAWVLLRHRRPLLRVGAWGLLLLVRPLCLRHRRLSGRVLPDHYPVPSFHRRVMTYTHYSMVHGRPPAV